MSPIRLAIGTVQFGTNYGISNDQGQVSQLEQKAILNFASEVGIDMLDTAINYGDSESNLGNYGVNNFKLITKIPPIPDNLTNVTKWIQAQVKSSMGRLGLTSLYGLLLHRSDHLLKYKGEVADCLADLKSSGLIKKIGVSIYSPNELDSIVGIIPIDIVQVPISIIDQRMQTTGWLDKLKSKKIEVHARSIFLQGLLLMPKAKIPKKFSSWNSIWNDWYNWHNDNPNYSPLETCLGFVNSLKNIDRIIIGVNSYNQIKEIIDAKKILKHIEYPKISCNDERLLYPSKWASL